LLCNGDDRCLRQKQGGAVGAAACWVRVPPKARSRHREPQPEYLQRKFYFYYYRRAAAAAAALLFFHGRGRNENALLPVTSFPVKSEGAVAKNSLSHGFAAPAPSRREPDMTVSYEASLIEGGGIA